MDFVLTAKFLPKQRLGSIPPSELIFLLFILLNKHRGLFVGFLRILPGLRRVLHSLPGVLVSGKVFSLAMLRCCRSVRVRSLLVKLSRSLMRIVCHVCSLRLRLQR